ARPSARTRAAGSDARRLRPRGRGVARRWAGSSFVGRQLPVVSPVRLLDVLEDDVNLIGRGLADVDHRLGDGGGDVALLLIGAAGEPLHCDVRHFEYLSGDWSGAIITRGAR